MAFWIERFRMRDARVSSAFFRWRVAEALKRKRRQLFFGVASSAGLKNCTNMHMIWCDNNINCHFADHGDEKCLDCPFCLQA